MGVIAAYMVPHPPIILPEIGKGEEQKINQTLQSYQAVGKEIADLKPDVIVISSPHSILYADYFHISPGAKAYGDFGQFRTPQVTIEADYDEEFVSHLSGKAYLEGIQAGTMGERQKELDHGTMVPLYFIKQAMQGKIDTKIVRIGLSGLPLSEHYRLGMLIKQTAEELDRRLVYIGSGDLSHRLLEEGPYGYQKEGPEYDKKIMDVMGNADFLKLFTFPETFCDKAGECGHRSFVIMAGVLDGLALETKKLSYEGPFGVGYGICSYHVTGTDENRHFLAQYEENREQELEELRKKEDAYVKLARASLEHYVVTGEELPLPKNLSEEMLDQEAGVFVSVKKEGALRGCIGTIAPVQENIAKEIIANAISAAVNDPRFDPIEKNELKDLVISVDVLGSPEPITSKEELDVKRYGVIVTKGYKRGLLLPNLDGIDTPEEQISIAKQKAGIQEEEQVNLERFEVVRHY
ncbi:MAG: AmmeMemoRadiSam system protein A [bacterium]|nr:AmmeMemoRadiSam system protein A [bacterium]